jgi:histidyl-tRNA synthetase
MQGSNAEKLDFLANFLSSSETGKQGVAELRQLLGYFEGENALQLERAELHLDLSLARGLNYYTGTILEVKARNIAFGSIGGGGRYNDLTSLFGVPNIPGVGISFGVDRIYDVLDEKNLFPTSIDQTTQVLFFNLGEAEAQVAYQQMMLLRTKKIACEMYPEKSKFDKQFKYAEKKGIPNIVIIGTDEVSNQTCSVKNLATGKQTNVAFKDLPTHSF